MDKSTNIKERVLQIADFKGVTKEKFFNEINMTYGNFKGKSKNTPLNSNALADILTIYNEISPEWLLTGKGEMLKQEHNTKPSNDNIIPIYDDAVTIGGTSIVAEPSASYGNKHSINAEVEYINAGDWFPNITAGIRHYGYSMTEYPNGCILALREIKSIQSIVWGRNYVIETDEMRVTKRMQTHENKDFIYGYSTNNETYSDGRLVHEPLEIEKKTIRKIFLVLGRIVKEYSSGVYSAR